MFNLFQIDVPVFRVRATGTPPSTTVINKSIKTETKPISVAAATNVCYEPKPTHTTSTTGGSVSVLACFKTTKKRNKVNNLLKNHYSVKKKGEFVF